MAAQQSIPFRKWVPGWLRVVAALIIMTPIMLINGAYTGSSVDISGALGILSEDISMAYYAAAAGMAVAYPLIPKVRQVVTTKTILLCDFILQIIFSIICATTIHIGVITVCSFFIGFLKAFVMLEMIIIIKPIFSPGNVRSEFYSYFYPLVFSLGQLSMILTALLAYNYQWQHMYYFIILLLLLGILTILICFRYGRRPIRIPFREIDWISTITMAVIMLLVIYASTYGKTNDWFASTSITAAVVVLPFLIWFFVRRQRCSSSPYLNLEVLKSPKAIIGYLFMVLVMFLSSSSAIVTSYANSVLRIDSVHTNELNLWMIPGFVCSAIVCYWWFKTQYFRFRVLIFWGMSCFVGYLSILYFGLMPDGTYEFLQFPMVLRGAGMMTLFIAFGVYAVEDMNPKLMIYNAFFLISARSVFAPALSAAFFSNAIYRIQQYYMMVLGENISLENPIAASRFSQTFQGALSQGNSVEDATRLATNNLYSLLQVQSLMQSYKTILGYLLIVAIVLMVVSRFTPFHKTLKVKVVKTGDDMV